MPCISLFTRSAKKFDHSCLSGVQLRPCRNWNCFNALNWKNEKNHKLFRNFYINQKNHKLSRNSYIYQNLKQNCPEILMLSKKSQTVPKSLYKSKLSRNLHINKTVLKVITTFHESKMVLISFLFVCLFFWITPRTLDNYLRIVTQLNGSALGVLKHH